jgi:hypothetical protein
VEERAAVCRTGHWESEAETAEKDRSWQRDCFCSFFETLRPKNVAMTQLRVEGAHSRDVVGREDGKRRGHAAAAAAPLGTSTPRLDDPDTLRL